MGLDMYAYVGTQGQQDAFYEGSEWDKELGEYVNPTVSKPRELAYWRKHPNLHGWMEKLWIEKTGRQTDRDEYFNGVELELTWEDIERLEQAILGNDLPAHPGFFFGKPSCDYYRDQDLEFIKNAKAELFCGLRVFYNSSW
jgi:hypothetical protein